MPQIDRARRSARTQVSVDMLRPSPGDEFLYLTSITGVPTFRPPLMST